MAASPSETMERLPDDTVLIVGGGPVGLLLSTVLAFYGVKSVLLERNKTTTKWPKMDLTNARSMEILRRLGLAEGVRERGVPSNIPYTVLISSGLNQPKAITKWLLPSVDTYRRTICEQNDGSQPLEPYQRISQAIFEAWLKESCDANPLIDLRYGWKVTEISSYGTEVQTLATNPDTGHSVSFISQYVAGCDGANSIVRRSLEIPLDGGPVPGYALLIHFKSRDLARLQKQGQFWHLFCFLKGGVMGGAVIAQDEIDTWTTHLFFPLDVDSEKVSSQEAVYTVLGGMGDNYHIKIDEVLVRSTFRANVAVARSYSGLDGKVFLAGDAAHQNIPTGGYGMNMGIGDAYDLGWKLAAVINGHGQKGLLDSYELERRPIAFLSVEHSKNHLISHGIAAEFLKPDPIVVDADTETGRNIRQKLHEHYQEHDGENKDIGIEMDFRYSSLIVIPDDSPAPEWNARYYTPTTFPGARAPHVFLEDGTAIFDLYGKDFTLIDFQKESDTGSQFLVDAAKASSVPVKHVTLSGEYHAAKIWERGLVLVRPDGHVSWRGDSIKNFSAATEIVERVTGVQREKNGKEVAFGVSGDGKVTTQTNTFVLDKTGDFQH